MFACQGLRDSAKLEVYNCLMILLCLLLISRSLVVVNIILTTETKFGFRQVVFDERDET
ncbi:hypothetical protein RchiOBHm_Chr2g0133551 [Rosa chinensis]|uniref:Uncharacterized protein n=1 Tax=Rosa chinensis TaxID=74649 RepID=A0A2P6RVM3_ROSCH|nr:hypothetical protein RchiOBHm_Chr2g0133551 [Rosa chinensis]